MNRINYYPVTFEDFIKVKSVGNYVIMYCLLDDRIHLEMAIENAVFVTQKFYLTIERQIKERSENFKGDALQEFIKANLEGVHYRYYPSEDIKQELSRIKLYTDLMIKKTTNVEELDQSKFRIEETDKDIRTFNGEELIMYAEKL